MNRSGDRKREEPTGLTRSADRERLVKVKAQRSGLDADAPAVLVGSVVEGDGCFESSLDVQRPLILIKHGSCNGHASNMEVGERSGKWGRFKRCLPLDRITISQGLWSRGLERLCWSGVPHFITNG
jgi:hypothetical protein